MKCCFTACNTIFTAENHLQRLLECVVLFQETQESFVRRLGPCLFKIIILGLYHGPYAHMLGVLRCTCMHKFNQPGAAPCEILQPTIIIDASLNVDIHLFLMNFGTICNCAFLGTTISSFTIGTMQWAFGAVGLVRALPFNMSLVSLYGWAPLLFLHKPCRF